jgi:23S rRNA (adenine-N6)-dimethyltransferase
VPGARRRWGWHQLDPRWAERIVGDAGVGKGDLVLDVGAGFGALTEPLLAAGARVIAVERHPGRAAALRSRFGAAVTVVEADGADLRLPRRPFHVVANPPFTISAALLRRLVHPGSRLASAHVVLQRQVVRRWTGPEAPAAARWQRGYTTRAGVALPRTAFRPPPAVDCRVLVIERR